MKNRLITIILILLLIFSNGVFANSLTLDNSFQNFSIEELDKYEDVKKFTLENGYNENVINDLVTKSFKNSSNLIINNKIKKEIVESYGLDYLDATDSIMETYVLVKRNEKRDISNVWYLQYIRDNAGFKVNVLNVGKYPLDKIEGKVILKSINKNTWNNTNSIEFSKKNVKTGNVFNWSKPLNNSSSVAENFEYKITVTNDNYVWTYDNKDKVNLYRYNFAVGYYNKLTANGGERHHFVSNNSLTSAGFSSNAPCIRMLYRDHTKTSNYGNMITSKAFRQKELQLLKDKKYKDLLQMEVDSFKSTPDPGGAFSSLLNKYYDQVILVLYSYEQFFGLR